MTQPPEVTEARTDVQRLEDAIVTACRTIREHWGSMLPTAPAAVSGSAGRSAGVLPDRSEPVLTESGRLTWLADQKDGQDIDGMTRITSLRRFVTEQLNGWCRVVMEDRPITNSATLPDGTDAPGMAEFVERHAEWLSRHDSGECAADELSDRARDVTAITNPFRRDFALLGTCPIDTEDGEPCDGRVRSRIGVDTDEAKCDRCGLVKPWDEWLDLIGTDLDEVVNAKRMSHLIATRLHVTVTERTVRNWARQDQISAWEPFGPLLPTDHKLHVWRFVPAVVLKQVALMGRPCDMCGNTWSGVGLVCQRCYSTMKWAKPRRAVEGSDWPPLTLVAKTQADQRPRSIHEAQRCGYSDLPLAWCACGRRHA